MGRKFRLGLHRKYAAECSKGGAFSLVVSLPQLRADDSCVFRTFSGVPDGLSQHFQDY